MFVIQTLILNCRTLGEEAVEDEEKGRKSSKQYQWSKNLEASELYYIWLWQFTLRRKLNTEATPTVESKIGN